jgi:hypothetical protein
MPSSEPVHNLADAQQLVYTPGTRRRFWIRDLIIPIYYGGSWAHIEGTEGHPRVHNITPWLLGLGSTIAPDQRVATLEEKQELVSGVKAWLAREFPG